jgi:hypothetical protein
MSAVDFRHVRGERANTASRCLVQSWEQARGRGVLAYLEGAVGVLDLVAGAPPGNKGAGQRGIVEVDRDRAFSAPCRPAGAIAQPVGAATRVEPRPYLVYTLLEAAARTPAPSSPS